MSFFQQAIDRVIKFWKKKSKREKNSFIGLFVTLGIVIGTLMYFYSKDSYKYLMKPSDTAVAYNITQSLKSKNITYRIKEDNTIEVAGVDVKELQLELSGEGLLDSKDTSLELFTKPMFQTPSQEKNMEKTLMETRIQSTIKTYKEVDDVSVHLTLGNESAFKNENTPSKAGVVLKLKNKLTPKQVESIQAFVAAAVPNLDRENVVITDTNNNLLSGSDSFTEADSDYEKSVEDKISKQIEDLLSARDSTATFKVSTNVEMDFDKRKIEKETVESGPNTVVSKQTTTEKSSTTPASTTPAGTDANIPSYQGQSGTSGSGAEKTTEVVNYELNKTKEEIIKHPEIKKLSVTVTSNKPLEDTDKQGIKDLVSTAALIDETRGDKVFVFGGKAEETKESAAGAKAKIDYLYYIDFGLRIAPKVIGIIVLIVVILKMKKWFSSFDDDEEEEEKEEMLERERDKERERIQKIISKPEEPTIEEVMRNETRSRLKKDMEQSPEQVANVIRSWMSEMNKR